MPEQRRNAQIMRHKTGLQCNLTYRVGKPALFAGRLQKAIERAFIAHNGPISTAEAGIWCYPRAERPDYSNVKRVLKRIGAVKLRRLGGSARPLLWAPPLI
jgi:hypothetical protein